MTRCPTTYRSHGLPIGRPIQLHGESALPLGPVVALLGSHVVNAAALWVLQPFIAVGGIDLAIPRRA